MLLQPQRPAQARTTGSGIGPSTSTRKNSSMASFTSSSHDEAFDASSSSHRQSGSSRGHHSQPPKQQSYFSSPHSFSLPLDGSSDVEYSKYGTAPRRTKKLSAASHGSRMTANSSSSNSDVDTLRGLGRKLFNRSTSNLKAAPLLASRSQSASRLPSNISVLDVKEVAMTGVSSKTRQEGFLSDSEGEYGRNSISRDAGGSSFSHASPSFVSIPSVGHSASPSAFASGAVGARRDIPAVIEEEGDSDFLRAVLNFGEGGEDGLLSSPSFRGGRAAPLPTRSSSLGQIAGATSSPRVPPRRAADGRVILVEVGEVLIEGARVGMTARGGVGGVPAVGYSPRIRVLAGLPTMEEERRMRYPEVITRKFRPRDMQSKRTSRVSVSEGGVWEGPARNGRTSRESLLASPSQKQKRLAPWMTPSPQQPQLLSPRSTAQPRTARAASEGQAQTAFVTTHRNSSTALIPEVNEVVEEPKSTEEKSGDSSDEEVPLAQLQVFRAQRAIEKERIQKLESELAMLRQKDQKRGREEEERKAREEEARRIDAEPTVKQGASLSSPSSPNLTMNPPTSSRAAQQSTELAKLQGNPLASRSATSLYIQQEGQRRSRTSVIASPEAKAAVKPMASPGVKPSPTMPTPQMEIQRQYSMASLAHRASMATFPVPPQITQRQTSLLPPQPLHHTTSMQHLSQLPSSPNMLAASPTGFLQPLQPAAMDPRHPMSMTNLNAQVYMHQQQMQMGMGMGMVQKPGMAQTAKVSSSSRPPLQP
ncbi:uncharacterized protein UBRO2_04176 [Ustilago bromivora]|uniref:Uncharacterized protein n=1 Tax=Ustilago bromivora TaxID=307758 RepID=A0A8H8QP86_9BASI|nr:uncharacterized protein UBRO2_04176 [Ustilago bromivora]